MGLEGIEEPVKVVEVVTVSSFTHAACGHPIGRNR